MYQNDDFATGYAVGRDSSNGNNGWGFGNGWEGLIGLALVAGLFGGGWGFGGFGGGRGGNCATQADLSAGFASNSILSNLNEIILSQAQGFANVQQTLCQGFSGVNATVNQGFAGVNNAICTLGYQNQAGFNGIANQIASCCCDVKSLLLENRYLNERQTCDLITNANNNTRQIIDYLTSEKISSLQAENSGLKAQISNDRQTASIISGLRDTTCPIPAYVVPNPNCCYNPYGFGFGTCGASVQ